MVGANVVVIEANSREKGIHARDVETVRPAAMEVMNKDAMRGAVNRSYAGLMTWDFLASSIVHPLLTNGKDLKSGLTGGRHVGVSVSVM